MSRFSPMSESSVRSTLDSTTEKEEHVTQDSTIVVGVDGSEHGEQALDWAIDEAKLRGARLLLISAWHVPAIAYGGPGFAPQLDEPLDRTFEEVAEESVAAALKRVRAAGLEAEREAGPSCRGPHPRKRKR